MKPTLVVMAAGMGSRYGGLKQIDGVGPAGEIVIDYSVYDALQAGFGKVVFIIRRDIEAAFKEVIEPHFAGRVALEYVFQELDRIPAGFKVPPARKKPWGTGHAILCCREVVHEPFGVINADDFYGRDAFLRLGAYLSGRQSGDRSFVLVGYELAHTLSEHGAVARGVCQVDGGGRLQGVVECTHIARQADAIVAAGGNAPVVMAADTTVSMNMWGFTPALFDELDPRFRAFLSRPDLDKAEFYIPEAVDGMLKQKAAEVTVSRTSAHWMGMTYPDDRAAVRAGIQHLVAHGEYPSPLWPTAGKGRSRR